MIFISSVRVVPVVCKPPFQVQALKPELELKSILFVAVTRQEPEDAFVLHRSHAPLSSCRWPEQYPGTSDDRRLRVSFCVSISDCLRLTLNMAGLGQSRRKG